MSKKVTPHDNSADHLVVFQEKAIRRLWNNQEWWFSMIDVCGPLTDSHSPQPAQTNPIQSSQSRNYLTPTIISRTICACLGVSRRHVKSLAMLSPAL